jgi:hypothetical protein
MQTWWGSVFQQKLVMQIPGGYTYCFISFPATKRDHPSHSITKTLHPFRVSCYFDIKFAFDVLLKRICFDNLGAVVCSQYGRRNSVSSSTEVSRSSV